MYRVLIADDEEIIKIGLRSMISWEKYGFEIVGTAENGEQALRLVQELNPDVVITDLYMPVMDGLELIKRMKQNGYACEIIVLSNYGDVDYVKKAMKMGAEDYLLKVSYDQKKFIELLHKLRKLLDDKKQDSKIWPERNIDKSTDKIKELLSGIGKPDLNLEKEIYQIYYLVLPYHLEQLEYSQYCDVLKKVELVLNENFNMYQEKHFIAVDKLHCIFIVNSSGHYFTEDNSMHIKMQKALAVYLMINTSVLYENNIMGMNKLRQSFIKARERCEIVFWKTGCYKISAISFSSITGLIHIPKAVNRYHRYIENPDLDRLQFEIQNVLLNFEKNFVNPAEVKQFVITLLSNIRVFIYQCYGRDMNVDYEKSILNSRQIGQLRQILEQWMEDLRLFLKDSETQTGNEVIIERIKHYIEQHLDEKIRVNELADYFNFHPNYLSTYFKEQTGINLINYINQMKMEHAKSLLEQKKYRVKEVAVMVGIEDPLYFNKMFKSFYGCPPSRYEKESK